MARNGVFSRSSHEHERNRHVMELVRVFMFCMSFVCLFIMQKMNKNSSSVCEIKNKNIYMYVKVYVIKGSNIYIIYIVSTCI